MPVSTRVRQTLQRVGKDIVIKERKPERGRRALSLPPSSVKALKVHKDRQTFERAKAGKRWQETGLVFTTLIGTPLEPWQLTRKFKGHLATAEQPQEWRFYDMRYAAASLLIADAMPITAVSAMLGHALTSTTLNVYAHVLPGADYLTAEAMKRLLGYAFPHES
jgi:integrase